jgi:hypothetical protein
MAAAAIPWVIGAVMAVGAIKQAQAASENSKAQAAALDFNARVSEQQASSALSESVSAQMAQRRRARELMGRSRAAAAQSGVGFGGSTADILEQSETLAELDALNIAYEGQMKARGFVTQSTLDTFNAGRARANAKSAKQQGYFNAIGAFAGPAMSSFGSTAPKTTVGSGGYRGISTGGGVGLRSGGGIGLRYS